MLWMVDLAFEQPVRSISNIAEVLVVTYAGAGNNVVESGGRDGEELATYPKLIRFSGWWRLCGWCE